LTLKILKSKENRSSINQKDIRKKQIIEFVSQNPGQTAYSISKYLSLPITSVIEMLNELDEELEIKFEESIEGGRLKKKVFVRTINDFTYTLFNEESLNHPLTKKLIQNSQSKGLEITIKMSDGREIILKPNQDLTDFLDKLNK
jgi:hypothetical protein